MERGEAHTFTTTIPSYVLYKMLIMYRPHFNKNTVGINPCVKDTLNEGHLSNEDTVCRPNDIELCTHLPLN